LFEEERINRELVIKEVIKTNKLLIEERKKKEEEAKNGGSKNKLGTFLDRGDKKRGISSYKNRKGKKNFKSRLKTNSGKNTNKINRRERRNTMVADVKGSNSSNLNSLTPKESKDTIKVKSFLTATEVAKRTQSVSKGNIKLFK